MNLRNIMLTQKGQMKEYILYKTLLIQTPGKMDLIYIARKHTSTILGDRGEN